MAETLRYPSKYIGNQDDFFKISILKYEAPGLKQTGGFALGTAEQKIAPPGSVINALSTIILPMPANIQDTNAAGWTEGTMNPLQASLLSAGVSAVESGNVAGSVLESIKNLGVNVADAVNDGSGQQAVAASAATLAMQALTGQGDISAGIARVTGKVFNQNVELLFNGVSLRPAFSFSWNIAPRSQPESIMVKKIINTLKRNMTPKKGNQTVPGGGLFIDAPNVFKIEYMSGGKPHPFLHRFKICALTQMNVNYNASAQYATYSDATPVHMEMTLQFQELSPIYYEDYDTTDGKQGVGY